MATPKYLKDARGFCYAYTPELARMKELEPYDGALDKHGFARGSQASKDDVAVNSESDTTDADVKALNVAGNPVAQSAMPGSTVDDGGLSSPVIVTEDTVAGKPRAPASVEGVATDPNAEDLHPTKPETKAQEEGRTKTAKAARAQKGE